MPQPAAYAAPVMRRTVGGRYVLEQPLGEGGTGRVYRARSPRGEPVALKLLAASHAVDDNARARFRHEAQLASTLAAHPNIVSVIDHGEDPAFGEYLVMELVDGTPLVHAVPMPRRRACHILGQIADALSHIHARGVVHGDVKADNILLADDVARLLDFGLARRRDAPASNADHVAGSPHYLAPERAAGWPPSIAADIYALGVLGFLVVTGALPFAGNVVEILMAHISHPPPSLGLSRGDRIAAGLEALITRAMAKAPQQRHPSAAAFRAELDALDTPSRLAVGTREELHRITLDEENRANVGHGCSAAPVCDPEGRRRGE